MSKTRSFFLEEHLKDNARSIGLSRKLLDIYIRFCKTLDREGYTFPLYYWLPTWENTITLSWNKDTFKVRLGQDKIAIIVDLAVSEFYSFEDTLPDELKELLQCMKKSNESHAT